MKRLPYSPDSLTTSRTTKAVPGHSERPSAPEQVSRGLSAGDPLTRAPSRSGKLSVRSQLGAALATARGGTFRPLTAPAPAQRKSVRNPPSQFRIEVTRRAIIQSPHLDVHRREYAALMREVGRAPRAELVERQLRIARGHACAGDKAQVRALLASRGATWASESLGPVAPQVRVGWRRGFIERVETSAAFFVDHAERISNRVPLQALFVSALDCPLYTLLAALPAGRLVALSLANLGIDDTGAKEVARANQLHGLRWLDLSGNAIGDEGFKHLVNSPHLRFICWIGLADNPSRLIPRPGGFEDGDALDVSWPAEYQHDGWQWLSACAEGARPRWFEV